MIAELISVGTELLMGQTVDTNSAFLSKELSNMGIDVFYKCTVGDNPARLRAVIETALLRSDIVITTGGLGPTEDDITKQTVAELMGLPLYLNGDCLRILEERMHRYNRTAPMTENNRRQAMIPQGAIVMPNPRGTAPGCIMEKDGKIAVVLPGPPFEMTHMFQNHVKPFLEEKSPDVLLSHFVRILGLGESLVATLIDDLIKNQTNPTLATYISNSDVMVRITAKCKKGEDAMSILKPVEDEVLSRLGNAVYAVGEVDLCDVVSQMLIDEKKTLAVAESCTGGWLCSQLVHRPGASAFLMEGIVAYSNAAKVRLLEVPQAMLDEHGAVSEAVAIAMASNARRLAGTDFGISTTGIAGPDGGTPEKPVGTVFVAVADKNGAVSRNFVFSTDRTRIRARALTNALNLLRLRLLGEV